MNCNLCSVETKWVSGLLAGCLLLSVGCVRRTTHSRWFGLFDLGSGQRKAGQSGSGARLSSQKAARLPDDSVREALAFQARGAVDPEKSDQRVRLLKTRLRLDPEDLAARLELAAIYERYRLYEDALEQYSQVLSFASQVQDSSETLSRVAEAAAVGLGRSARAIGRGSEAIPVLAAFLKKRPRAEVWSELGICYDAAGERAAAEHAFRRALSLQPASDRVHNNLGFNLLLQNKLDAAEAEFRRALQLNPKSAMAHNNLGTTLARRADLDGALGQFLMAGDAATAHNNLAVVLLELGDYERSREELVKALAVRNYLAPAMENFKLVQQLLRQRAEVASTAQGLPLQMLRVPAGLTLAASRIGLSAQQESPLPNKREATESPIPEDLP